MVKSGVIVLINGKIDPLQASQGIRQKIFRPQRLDHLDPPQGSVCDKCCKEESGPNESETFFCKRFNTTITRDGGPATVPVTDN